MNDFNTQFAGKNDKIEGRNSRQVYEIYGALSGVPERKLAESIEKGYSPLIFFIAVIVDECHRQECAKTLPGAKYSVIQQRHPDWP